jgi:hypothetical protein
VEIEYGRPQHPRALSPRGPWRQQDEHGSEHHDGVDRGDHSSPSITAEVYADSLKGESEEQEESASTRLRGLHVFRGIKAATESAGTNHWPQQQHSADEISDESND